jgi:hypothetical protein
MSDQHPGVEDEVERALRLGLAMASQMADRFARARQDLARQEARQLEARYHAEGASTTASRAVVDRTEWWDRATPADITAMWHLAAQWQDEQPRAATAAEAIARQVLDRYDVDVRAPGVDAESVLAALSRLEAEQSDRTGRPQDGDDTVTAVGAVLRAEQRDAALSVPADDLQGTSVVREEPGAHRAVEPSSATPYDSVERREQTASRLRDAGLQADTVAVAMRADVAHARPAADAVVASATTSRHAGAEGAVRGTHRPDRSR